MINRKFLHFNTEAAFDQVKNTIPYDSIVFIKDTRKIYTHGAYYLCLQEAKRDSDIYFIGGVTEVIYIPGEAFHEPQLNNPNRLPVTYTSSNPNVATVNESGVITVSEDALDGQYTTITVTFPGDNTYEPKTVRYTLKVNKKEPTISFSSSSISATVGVTPTNLPTVVKKPGESFVFEYDSLNTDVITIKNSTTGSLNAPIKAGTATITATSEETPVYKSKTIQYTISVENPQPVEPTVYWSTGSATMQIGNENNTFPQLTNNSGKRIIYSSSNPNVASIGTYSGVIQLQESGVGSSTQITAKTEDQTQTASYILSISPYPMLVWSKDSDTVEYGDQDHTYPILRFSPEQQDYITPIRYNSTNPNVATIGANGAVHIVSVGTTKIQATTSACDTQYVKFSSKTVEYVLTVTEQSVVNPNLRWSSNSASVTYNSNGVYTLPVLTNTYNVSVKYTTSNSNIAEFQNQNSAVLTIKNVSGTVTIYATHEAESGYSYSQASYTLNVTAQSQPQPSETFEVGYGYIYNGVGYYQKRTTTTVAGTYKITIPSGVGEEGARLCLQAPADKPISSVKQDTGLGQIALRFLPGTSIPGTNPPLYLYQDLDGRSEPGEYTLVVS